MWWRRVGGENQKYGIAQVQIFSFFDFPDPHLTFTRPGPGPELDNYFYFTGAEGGNRELEFPCEQAGQVIGGEEVGRFRHQVPQATADPLEPHPDGHAAQQVPLPGQDLHQQGADHEASNDEEL